MLTLHVEAPSVEGLLAAVAAELQVTFTYAYKAPAEPAPAAAPVLPQPQPVDTTAGNATLPSPTPRATRKRAEKPTEPVTPTAAIPAANPVPAVPTVDQVREALRAVQTKDGEPAVAAMLKKYGVDRVSAVPEDKRAALIAECVGATPAAAPVAFPTADEVRYALSEVSGKHGMPACVELLKRYGVDRPSNVPEAKRTEFIAACKAKAAAKP